MKAMIVFFSGALIVYLLLAGIAVAIHPNASATKNLANNLENVLPLSADSPGDEILELEYPDPLTDESITELQIENALNNRNLLVTIDPNYSHAEIEHPDTVTIVRDCFSSKGQYVAFQIEKKKRYLRVCLIDEGTIGFQIVDIVGRSIKEKTCYIKESLKSAKEVFEYARKMGYPRFTGPL